MLIHRIILILFVGDVFINVYSFSMASQTIGPKRLRFGIQE